MPIASLSNHHQWFLYRQCQPFSFAFWLGVTEAKLTKMSILKLSRTSGVFFNIVLRLSMEKDVQLYFHHRYRTSCHIFLMQPFRKINLLQTIIILFMIVMHIHVGLSHSFWIEPNSDKPRTSMAKVDHNHCTGTINHKYPTVTNWFSTAIPTIFRNHISVSSHVTKLYNKCYKGHI